jgi:hypothetical protein
MRIEYAFRLDDVEVPYFSVESIEGPEKLFRLATLILNVMEVKRRVDVIFHSPNLSDLPKKIEAFEKILGSAPKASGLQFRFEEGEQGTLGSSYYRWISIHSSGGRASG